MLENNHLRIGYYFSSLPQFFMQHTVDGESDLTIFLYCPGKLPSLLMELEVASYDLRSAYPELITLAFTILVFLSSCKEVVEPSDDTG